MVWGVKWWYLVENLPSLSKTVQAFLKEGDVLFCTGPEDVLERFKSTLALILPIIGVRYGDAFGKTELETPTSCQDRMRLTFIECPLERRNQTPVPSPPLAAILNCKPLVFGQLRPE